MNVAGTALFADGMEPAGYQTNYMRKIILFLQVILCGLAAQGQSLKKPDVPEPTLKMVKAPKYRANSAGSMGLFDWNFSLGYINKTATVKQTGTLPLDVESSGQYAMFHLQESILSNYFLAKKYKRNKRFKIGFQNTFDFGMKRGGATIDATNYAVPSPSQETSIDFYFNYQAAIATAFRINSKIDVGYSYYLYVKSVFSPETDRYSKARVRFGHFMGEYSFGGLSAVELKYVKNRKVYYGLGYTKNNQQFSNGIATSSAVQTNWYQVSIGRVF